MHGLLKLGLTLYANIASWWGSFWINKNYICTRRLEWCISDASWL